MSSYPMMPPATQELSDPFRLRVTHRDADYKEVVHQRRAGSAVHAR